MRCWERSPPSVVSTLGQRAADPESVGRARRGRSRRPEFAGLLVTVPHDDRASPPDAKLSASLERMRELLERVDNPDTLRALGLHGALMPAEAAADRTGPPTAARSR